MIGKLNDGSICIIFERKDGYFIAQRSASSPFFWLHKFDVRVIPDLPLFNLLYCPPPSLYEDDVCKVGPDGKELK